MASRLVRTNAVTVGDVLDGRKLLKIDCVDRVYLTVSVPGLVAGGQVVSFLTAHERNPIRSPAFPERRGLAFRRAVARFAQANDIPVLSFAGKRTGAAQRCWLSRRGRNARSTSCARPRPPRPITLTAPRHARAFFEVLAADNLGIGRPDNMEIIFSRQVRCCVTKGVFRTPSTRDNNGVVLNAFYRHSRVKTYLKDGRALRVETVMSVRRMTSSPAFPGQGTRCLAR